jgi:hypothetical protein
MACVVLCDASYMLQECASLAKIAGHETYAVAPTQACATIGKEDCSTRQRFLACIVQVDRCSGYL